MMNMNIFKQVRLKPACAVTETTQRLVIELHHEKICDFSIVIKGRERSVQ